MMLDPFNTNAFKTASLTAAINHLPPAGTYLDNINLMPAQGVTQRTVLVEERSGILTLLPTKPVGSPGTLNKGTKRTVRSFIIPHIPLDDTIFPEDVNGLRGFGQESALEALSAFVNTRQQDIRNKHDITLEHLRFGALKGTILDADGSTLYDLADEFGITGVTSYADPRTNWKKKLSLDFVLGTSTTTVLSKTLDVARHIKANMGGEVYSGITALVRSSFFDALTDHSKVKDAYARWRDGEALRSDMTMGFTFGPITFIEHDAGVPDPDGTLRDMIADGEGIAFPTGTRSTFSTYFAPADFNEAVNTTGQRLYSKIEARKFGRGWDLHTQSNPLPMCHRPAVLVRLHSSN